MTARSRIALIALLAAIYAVCYAAIKAGLAFAPPLRFAALRATIAGSVLLLVLAALRAPLLPPRRLWPGIFAISAIGTVLGYGAMFMSPGRTGAGIASVLGNTGPVIAIALAALFLREHLTRAKLMALLLGFAGVSLIAYPAVVGSAPSGRFGALLPLLAAVGTASESVLVKRLGIREERLRVAAWQLLLGSVPLLLASFWLERAVSIEWSSGFLGLLLFLSLAGTAFATALWYRLLQDDEVGRLTVLLFLVPLLGLVLAVLLFGERIGAREAAGVLVALLGIGLVARESWSVATGADRLEARHGGAAAPAVHRR